jgi:two-component sensor histidine kinase
LGDIIALLLAPYDDTGAFSGRIRIAVPRMGVGENSATTLALVIHELATNSLKYGALSVETGLLDVSGQTSDGFVHMIWTERGGPPASRPTNEGYGSKLLLRSIAGQLGGSIATDWSADGVIVTMTMRADKLAT